MGKIYYIMGKSSSGKDTLFRKIKQELPMLQTVTLYTTRPKREGEREGVEYHFVTDEQMHIFERQGKVVELRTYNTVHGAWKYATIEDGQVNLAESDYLMIGTLEAYEQIRAYFGAEHVCPIYVEVDDGVRLQRALERERSQEQPKYAEMCRRFLADEQDFSEENLKKAEITKHFLNKDLDQVTQEIASYIDNKY